MGEKQRSAEIALLCFSIYFTIYDTKGVSVKTACFHSGVLGESFISHLKYLDKETVYV